jgi:hypothetical protein
LEPPFFVAIGLGAEVPVRCVCSVLCLCHTFGREIVLLRHELSVLLRNELPGPASGTD